MDRIVDVIICWNMSCMSFGTADDIDNDEEAPDDLSRIFTDAPSVYTATGSILGSTGGNRLKTAS
jgi:hypothetical protein